MILLPLGAERDDLQDAPDTWPVATGALVLLLVLVHALTEDLPAATRVAWYFHPETPLGPGALTYAFLHSGWMHLLGNCLFLAAFGAVIEQRLGRGWLVGIFLFGSLTAAWLYGLTSEKVRVVTGAGSISFYKRLVGASGGVAGVIGCLLPTLPRVRIRLLMGLGTMWRVVAAPAWVVVVLYVARELYQATWSQGSGVGYMAHVGGALGGIVAALAVPRLRARLAGEAPEQLEVERGAASVMGLRALASAPGEGAETDLPEDAAPSVEASLDRRWAQDVWIADLNERIQRARRFEKEEGRRKVAERFYTTLMRDRRLPSNYRAYAGARKARLLLKRGESQAARELSDKLLRNVLAPQVRHHLRQTRLAACKEQARRA